MKTIASFTIDHNKLDPGMYISRVDGDVVTYDVRMVKPNGGRYLANPALHTLEHLFATYVRNSAWADAVVYVGPMGCRTGFYFLTRDTMPKADAIRLIQQCFAFIKDFEGDIPGASRKECGNYLEHDLNAAKEAAAEMCRTLQNWVPAQLDYDFEG
ncbi:MAG: S-ribosylhomocysteine lyase [Oscillospiraceae bacterium]|nr:S-ribosylhomocysteine lyase [Oscillospiraceae bacterium]